LIELIHLRFRKKSLSRLLQYFGTGTLDLE
jgi:hypothetical protein